MTPLTLRELVLAARQDILDDLPGDLEDACGWESDDDGLLWKNAELVRWLNEASREAARRRPIEDATTEAVTRFVLAPGQREVALDPRILYVSRVRLARLLASPTGMDATLLVEHTGEAPEVVDAAPVLPALPVPPAEPLVERRVILQKTGADALDRSRPNWEAETAQEPTHYLEDLGEYRMTVYPAPARYVRLELTVARLPLASLRWTHRYTDKPELNPRHHLDLLQWVAWRAYNKRDNETYDPQRAATHLAEFNRAVGMPVSAELEQHRRLERNRRRTVTPHYF